MSIAHRKSGYYILSGHIISRSGRFSWRRSVRGTTIQIPLRTTERKTAIVVGATATAASYAVFHDIRYRGLGCATEEAAAAHPAFFAAHPDAQPDAD